MIAPQEADLAMCTANCPVSPMSLNSETWSECKDSEWVLIMLSKDYGLQYARKPLQF